MPLFRSERTPLTAGLTGSMGAGIYVYTTGPHPPATDVACATDGVPSPQKTEKGVFFGTPATSGLSYVTWRPSRRDQSQTPTDGREGPSLCPDFFPPAPPSCERSTTAISYNHPGH